MIFVSSNKIFISYKTLRKKKKTAQYKIARDLILIVILECSASSLLNYLTTSHIYLINYYRKGIVCTVIQVLHLLIDL